MKKAVILLSGGIDSTTLLALAKQKARECHALSFDYGQRHKVELHAAKILADRYGAYHTTVSIDASSLSGSSLLDKGAIPKQRQVKDILEGAVPSTYVPARNTLFLSYAMGLAESISAEEIYFGANLMDRNAYPDCTPEYVRAFQQLINASCRLPIQLIAPLLDMDKKAIIALACSLDVPLDICWSCYDPLPGPVACQTCDACVLRKSAFAD